MQGEGSGGSSSSGNTAEGMYQSSTLRGLTCEVDGLQEFVKVRVNWNLFSILFYAMRIFDMI